MPLLRIQLTPQQAAIHAFVLIGVTAGTFLLLRYAWKEWTLLALAWLPFVVSGYWWLPWKTPLRKAISFGIVIGTIAATVEWYYFVLLKS
jgi:hypothetical protein